MNINSWEHFCLHLAANLGRDPAADYYFMAVSKIDRGDVFWTTLKSLKVLRSSGSNPPYQCQWAANRERQARRPDEAAHFLLTTLRQSFVKGADPLLSFDRHLQRFVAP